MPTSDLRLEKLADLLEKQILDPTLTDGTIWDNLGLSRTNFYRLKPKALEIVQTRTIQRQKAIEDTKTQQTIQAVKQGLKSKNERVLILQKEVDQCLHELYGDDAINYSVVGGRLLNVKKQLTVEQKVSLRKIIRELQAEISKIEGDYAPNKFEDVTKPKVLVPGE